MGVYGSAFRGRGPVIIRTRHVSKAEEDQTQELVQQMLRPFAPGAPS